MQKVTYTNNKGQSVSFGYTPPLVLSGIEGLGDADAFVQSVSAPYQDGATHIDTLLEQRAIPLTFTILGRDYKEVSDFRKMLSQVFNPKLSAGTLTYENNAGSWDIKAVCDGSPFFPSGDSRGQTKQIGTVDLIAHDPYWTDATDTKKSLAAYRQSLTLPFEMPALMGVEGQSDVLINDGHVATPIHIEFYGPSTNPVITNETTGEFIKVYRELASDEKLIIDTGFNRKRVVIEKNGVETNAYGYVDWFESDFITLIPGENSISYKADVGTEDAIVSIEYRQRYLGI